MFRAVWFSSVLALVLVSENEAARILAYYPTPSISHQIVFRPLTLELAKRGHDVVVITTDPMYPKGDSPANLKEIDVHDLSYTQWRKMLLSLRNNVDRSHFDKFTKFLIALVEEQLNTSDVQKLLNDKSVTFDLVIVESFVEVALGLSYFYKTPVIQFSSLAAGTIPLKIYGAPIHPVIYPNPFHEKLYNLSAWDKISEAYQDYKFEQIIPNNLELNDGMLKRVFGPDVTPFEELKTNVDMLFLNVHALWDFNRPVPPNIIYLGGLHQKPQKELPVDLQNYLDSSKNGVIYVSFGTNVDPALFPPVIIQSLVNVFSKLPYDVLWKWNEDELPGRTPNIRISKWLPQSDLLRHPKIKLFITQGGLQSTDEAITAGVPLLGVPIFGDQKFNVEQYLHFKIGVRVNINELNEVTLKNAIDTIVGDNSYRENVARLRTLMNDQPQTPLEKAVWWTEYVIRHKGAKHLRSPAANMSVVEYYELELVAYLLLGLLGTLGVVIYFVNFLYSSIFKSSKKVKKN